MLGYIVLLWILNQMNAPFWCSAFCWIAILISCIDTGVKIGKMNN